MIRTQISLAEEQIARLREKARRTGRSIAAILRDAVDAELARDPHEWEARRRRALEVVGKYHGGASDVAENHDAYLDEAFRHRG